MSLTTLNAYQQGGPILDKLKQLWGGIRSKADDPSLGYIGASMLPGVGEATDLVEIGAGLQDRSLGRVGLGLAGLMLPFVGAAGLKKIGKLDPAQRLKRKKEMGFDLDVYHGTAKRIDDLDPTVEMGDWTTFEKGKRGHLGRGIYVTPNADIASRFATEKIPTDKFGEPLAGMGSLYQPRVYPVTVRSGKLLDLPDDVARGIRERKVSNPRTVYDEIWNDAVEEFDNGIIGDDIDWEDYIAKGESQGAYPNTDPNFKYDMVKERVIELAKERGYQGLRSRSVVGDKDVINMFDMKDIRSATAAQFDPSKADVGHLLAGIGGLTGARYMSNALREDREN